MMKVFKRSPFKVTLTICFSIVLSGCGAGKGTNSSRGGLTESGTDIGNSSFSIIQSYEETLTLPYSGTFTADSCEISSNSGVNITTQCSCSSGVCTVGVTASSTGAASFNYSLSDGTETENGQTVITVSAVVPFTSTWRVGDGSYGDGDLTVTLPLRSGFNYNFTVDWGDTNTSVVTSHDDPDISHTYASTGTYTVTITGLVEAWYFNGSGDRNKLLTVPELGNVGWKSLKSAFNGCENLTTLAGGNTSSVTNMNIMFMNATNAVPDTSGWNTSNVTRMGGMFAYTNAANPDTSNWDTSKVTDLYGIFQSAISANPDTTNWDISNVTDLSYAFRDTQSANPNVGNWDTSAVKYLVGVFQGADVANPNVSTWDTSNVVRMNHLFADAPLADPDVSNWDTSNVVDMSYMFASATSADPDTTNWNTPKVNNMSNMFNGASLANPVMSNWDFSNMTSMGLGFFATGTSLSTTNYDNMLIQLDATRGPSPVALHVGTTKYTSGSAAETARNNLTTASWMISDGGSI
ncbi:MAG: hypothetical protein CME67_06755 [Halobacteriovoraceae bacterium]|nr:hypothetical protein [Halobacteriovoraceae bacterium]|tara:strand:- start:344 stop:1906 length:1563 start_codon:yes stop_codon:yes gene_type:complete